MSKIKNFLNRLFHYEIVNGPRGEIYLQRWKLLSLPNGGRIFLRNYLGSDWSLHMHDHQAWFISLGIKGSYVEEVIDSDCRKTKRWISPWIRFFSHKHIHRIRINKSIPAWTLIVSGPDKHEWGFYDKNNWIPWREYITMYGGQRGVD